MRNSFELPEAETQIVCAAISGEPKKTRSRRAGFLSIVRAEFGRALAALRRYEMLRAGQARREKLPPADIPRRVFEEFYAAPADPERAGMERHLDSVHRSGSGAQRIRSAGTAGPTGIDRARRSRAGFRR